jgi:hypothetical protein
MYDDPFLFVIVLIAKPPALVTDDESTNFVIECCHPVTNFVLVTSESSLINTFLVVCTKESYTYATNRLLEGRQNGLDTTGKRELPHTQLKKSNTHQVPPANE